MDVLSIKLFINTHKAETNKFSYLMILQSDYFRTSTRYLVYAKR